MTRFVTFRVAHRTTLLEVTVNTMAIRALEVFEDGSAGITLLNPDERYSVHRDDVSRVRQALDPGDATPVSSDLTETRRRYFPENEEHPAEPAPP